MRANSIIYHNNYILIAFITHRFLEKILCGEPPKSATGVCEKTLLRIPSTNTGIYVYTCIYMYIHVYIYIYIYTHIYICMYVCMYACMHAGRQAGMYVCMYVYIYIYIYIYLLILINLQPDDDLWTSNLHRMLALPGPRWMHVPYYYCVCIHIYIYIYTHALCYIYIYIHILCIMYYIYI